jgi:hypothetical protein
LSSSRLSITVAPRWRAFATFVFSALHSNNTIAHRGAIERVNRRFSLFNGLHPNKRKPSNPPQVAIPRYEYIHDFPIGTKQLEQILLSGSERYIPYHQANGTA